MPDPDDTDAAKRPVLRSLTCAHCGEIFSCSLGGGCWCDAEPVRLPLPDGGDCLCRDCLRKMAVA